MKFQSREVRLGATFLDMNKALCSILCGEDEWCFDGEDKAMKFNSDGTGEVCKLLDFPALNADFLLHSFGAVPLSSTGLL